MEYTLLQVHSVLNHVVHINPFPLIQKTVPPKITNPPEVFIIRGSFLANVLKTKISKPIKHKKHLKINEIPNSYNNFLFYLR